MFILQYESAVVAWLTEAIPSLVQAIYTEDVDRLTGSSDVVRYPSVIFWRDSAEQTLPQAYDIYDSDAGVTDVLSRGRFSRCR